ncbi:monooxygenase [Salmonella enterica subsp. enterica]|uniref:Monooxygenase n=1 Tax=Salmonella enterica I TaxID=59201 RepID=A0A379WME5_SALET|nr:monooxygenase [Salmonella enterica subsp. enterica]
MQQSGDEAFNQALTIAFDNRLGYAAWKANGRFFR